MLKLTIGIPVLDFTIYLENTLEGISKLSGLSEITYEIIIVQNGPLQAVPLWLKTNPHLRVIHQEVKGTSEARNRALMESRAEFIAFLDDDSYLPQEWLHEAFSYFTTPHMGAFTSPTLIHVKSIFSGVPRDVKMDFRRYFSSTAFQDLVPFDTCACMFRTETLKELGGFEVLLKRNEDLEMGTRLYRQGWMIAYGKLLVEGWENSSSWTMLKKAFWTYYYSKYFFKMYGLNYRVVFYLQKEGSGSLKFSLIESFVMTFFRPKVTKFALPHRKQFAVFFTDNTQKVYVPKQKVTAVFLGDELALLVGGNKVLRTSCPYIIGKFKEAHLKVEINLDEVKDLKLQDSLLKLKA